MLQGVGGGACPHQTVETDLRTCPLCRASLGGAVGKHTAPVGRTNTGTIELTDHGARPDYSTTTLNLYEKCSSSGRGLCLCPRVSGRQPLTDYVTDYIPFDPRSFLWRLPYG